MTERLTDEERQLLMRLLIRAINYKSNGETVQVARPLLQKIEGVDKVIMVTDWRKFPENTD